MKQDIKEQAKLLEGYTSNAALSASTYEYSGRLDELDATISDLELALEFAKKMRSRSSLGNFMLYEFPSFNELESEELSNMIEHEFESEGERVDVWKRHGIGKFWIVVAMHQKPLRGTLRVDFLLDEEGYQKAAVLAYKWLKEGGER